MAVHADDEPLACFGDGHEAHPVRGLVILCLRSDCVAVWCVPCLEVAYEACFRGGETTLPPALVARARVAEARLDGLVAQAMARAQRVPGREN